MIGVPGDRACDCVMRGSPANGGKSIWHDMYHVYVLENRNGKYYIGVTSNLEKRLKKHNWHGSEWTKHKGPWHLIYKEIFQDKDDAVFRERKIKSYKSGNAFKQLIQKAVI